MRADGRKIGTVTLQGKSDVAVARREVGKIMDGLSAKPIRKTRFVTAVSEIARNTVVHGGGGVLTIFVHERPPAVSVTCSDEGAGIADISVAMQDGYSTARSMGRGLGGARRLVDDFEIESGEGRGTTVRMLGGV